MEEVCVLAKGLDYLMHSKNPVGFGGRGVLAPSYSYEHQRSSFFHLYLVNSYSQSREASVMLHAFFPSTYDPIPKTTSIFIRYYKMGLFQVSFPTFSEMLKAKLGIILYSKGVMIIFL